MFKNISKEEMIEMLNRCVEKGLIKEVSHQYYSLSNKGEGKLVEYVYDFVEIMKDVPTYKNFSFEQLMKITTESLLQSFGSKLQALIILDQTEWKQDLPRQLEMPMSEFMEEYSKELEEYNKTSKKGNVEPKSQTDTGNVVPLSKKKKETIH